MDKETAEKVQQIAKNRIDRHYKNFVYSKWALDYVQAEKPIPKAWQNDFIDELTSNDVAYRRALEESIRYWGVRWL